MQRKSQSRGKLHEKNGSSRLSQLRLSNIALQPSAEPQPMLRKRAGTRSSNIIKGREDDTKKKLKSDNSSATREMESESQTSSHEDSSATVLSENTKDLTLDRLTKEDVKKAAELSALFLDTRHILQADFNVVNALPSKDIPANNSNNQTLVRRISRSTITRAEKVKFMIGAKYLYMQRIYEWSEANGSNNQHVAVEGVYNPLQILRNRKIRAKYNEYPKPLYAKTIPLACNVFSRHNDPAPYQQQQQQHHTHRLHHHHHHHHRREWRMVWAIELQEFIGDSRWRVTHWHELKDPHGKLWFPPKYDSTDDEQQQQQQQQQQQLLTKKNKKHRFRQRLHDKLFETSDEDESHHNRSTRTQDLTASESRNELPRRFSHEQPLASDGEINNLTITRSRSPPKRGLRSRVKKLYQGESSSSTNLLSHFKSKDDSAHDMDSAQLAEATIHTPTPDAEDIAAASVHDLQQEDSTTIPVNRMVAPEIRIEESSPDPNVFHVQDVQFQPSRKGDVENQDDSISTAVPQSLANNSSEDLNNYTEIQDQQEQELAKLYNYLTFFGQCCTNRTEYLLTVYPAYLQRLHDQINTLTSDSIQTLLEQMASINDDDLPAYENLYMGFLEETKSILHMANENHSIRIDTLLSTSDRCISEINASLSLDLRKTCERLEALDGSLFNRRMKTDIIHGEANVNKFLYLVLENLIVILLKFVWIVVNIYKGSAFFFRQIWRAIRLFI